MTRISTIILSSAVASVLLTAPVLARDSGEPLVVTSIADGGPGTLRQALQDAQNGDTITFDPSIFPPDAPASISLTHGV